MRTWVLCIVALSLAASAHAQEIVTLAVGTPAADEIFDQFGERYFEVSPGAGQHLIVVLEKPTGFASRLDVKFKALPTDTHNDDSDGGERDSSDQAVEAGVTKTGRYLIRVKAQCCDLGGPFTITAHTLATLPSLAIGDPLSDGLRYPLAERYYRVSPGAATHLFVVLEKPSKFASRLDINFKSLPADADADDTAGGERDGADQAVEIRTTKAGDYFVRVRAECCDRGGDYTLTAHSLATLPSLSSGVPLLDDLPDQLAAHYYRVATPAGTRLSVIMDKRARFASRLDIKFAQLPTDSEHDDSDGGDGDDTDQRIDIPLTKAGDYFVRVKATCCNRGGAYTLTLQALLPPPCPGDCDRSGEVTVDELLLMVNIALGPGQLATCMAGDTDVNGQITVDEILGAVNKALSGC